MFLPPAAAFNITTLSLIFNNLIIPRYVFLCVCSIRIHWHYLSTYMGNYFFQALFLSKLSVFFLPCRLFFDQFPFVPYAFFYLMFVFVICFNLHVFSNSVFLHSIYSLSYVWSAFNHFHEIQLMLLYFLIN